jgi:hypothetical protein
VAEIITTDDLPTALQSDQMIELMVAGANARATRVAPCLAGTGDDAPSDDQLAEARLVLVGAVKRWAESGAGALSAQSAGPFSQTIDTRQRTGYNLWPSEIESLQQICSAGTETSSGAFSITPGRSGSAHMPWCSLLMGATYCSCGADLTNYAYPLYEGGVLSDDTY